MQQVALSTASEGVYRQWSVEVLEPLAELHVFQSPVPSHQSSEIDKQVSSASQAARAAASVLCVEIMLATEPQWRPGTFVHTVERSQTRPAQRDVDDAGS